jgi:hypothetical protein
MEKSVRNLLQNATQAARRLLEEEFSQQLEGIYDILPSGVVLATPGAHLNASDRLRREKLVAALEHHQQKGMEPRTARAALLRETAFTTLNRFVALKMLEARGVIRESVSRGEQSSGFREFCALAEGLVTLPDRGYQLYIEALFDEIGREVKVLFDRREVAGLLWPRRPALQALLETLNAAGLATVWAEDETIGWVYQYFNGEEERRAMRDKSAAPRDSYELAVRNQFFSPRYVVAFLTDNTLGRLWYEICRGQTRLKSECRYLVYRPNEVFLAADEPIPANGMSEDGNSTPDASQAPIYVRHRAAKDPRDLKILDPAVGSAHFLLYAFALLLIIYEEAWAMRDLPASVETGSRLRDDYPDLAALRRAAPALILRHNLFGIDIDPRAAQIAELALWLRAQRAFSEQGLQRRQRPIIRKSNIVVAEAMPGDETLLQEYLAGIESRLHDLVRVIWQQMKLAGEAGSLLKIEETITGALAAIGSVIHALPVQVRVVGPNQAVIQQRIDFNTPAEQAFWQTAEADLLTALTAYIRQLGGATGMRRRLFADNVEHGIAFIHLCRQHYDVVLMNPPFGAASTGWKNAFTKAYPRTKNDLYAAFVERGLQLLVPRGLLGAITSRTGFFLTSFQQWREEILLKEAHPTIFADLGAGVLDSAMVETAAYCLEKATDRTNS